MNNKITKACCLSQETESNPPTLQISVSSVKFNLFKCSSLIPPDLINVFMQSKIAAELTVTTDLEYFKTVDVQDSDVKLLMIFHHGLVDGLKIKGLQLLL